jgi:hypothetical protein
MKKAMNAMSFSDWLISSTLHMDYEDTGLEAKAPYPFFRIS